MASSNGGKQRSNCTFRGYRVLCVQKNLGSKSKVFFHIIPQEEIKILNALSLVKTLNNEMHAMLLYLIIQFQPKFLS